MSRCPEPLSLSLNDKSLGFYVTTWLTKSKDSLQNSVLQFTDRNKNILLLLSSTTKSQRNMSQRAKKVVYNSTGLVDFAIVVVIFVLNLPNGQVLFLG